MNKGKTVYILGAGASKTANLPIQSEIIKLIFDIEEDGQGLSAEADLLNMEVEANLQSLMNYYSIFDQYRRDLGKFIVSNFSSQEIIIRFNSLIESAEIIPLYDFALQEKRKEIFKEAYSIITKVGISLEDLFTIFDNF